MWARLGASSPLGGASSRLRMSSWIIGVEGGFVARPRTSIRTEAPGPAWAAWTIFRLRQAHLLDSPGSPSKNGIRVRAAASSVSWSWPPSRARSSRAPSRRRSSPPGQGAPRPARRACALRRGRTGSDHRHRPLHPEPGASARPGLEREAAADLRGAVEPRRDLPDRDRRARRGRAGRDDCSNGALVLKGGGDPTLSTAGLRSLAAQVRAYGIRRVTGGIVGDESYFDARRMVAGWKPSFFIEESPPLSALVVDRARVGRFVTRTPALAAATAFRTALRARALPSTAARHGSARWTTSRSRSRRCTRRRSGRSSVSWTGRATTSPPRCC